jgi:hypothetical protein
MRRLKESAGIPELRCHLLRHTFANMYIAAGGSLRKLQKILGHSSVVTTAKIYTDPAMSELQDEHARVSPMAQRPSKIPHAGVEEPAGKEPGFSFDIICMDEDVFELPKIA